MKLEQIIKLKLNNFEISPMETKQVNLADYPWDECIADQIAKYGDKDTAEKVCGAIKAMYGSKEVMEVNESFVIPQPEDGEAEDAYVSRCMQAIGSEYDTQEQALAVCYAQLEK